MITEPKTIYWLIMFQDPTPSPDPGPTKMKLTPNWYNKLCEYGEPVFEFTLDGKPESFTIKKKRVFSMGNHAYIVADAVKNKQPE